ncbi:hypothetical protein MTO96_033352 [Rhipicephalus appendiculatus]
MGTDCIADSAAAFLCASERFYVIQSGSTEDEVGLSPHANGHHALRLPIVESSESGRKAFEIRPSSPVVDRRVSIAGAAPTASSLGPLPPPRL